MKTILFHHQDCSKSCEVLTMLEAAKEDFTIVDYVNNPPTIDELTKLIAMLGIEAENLVRKNEPVYLEQFSKLSFTHEQWIEIMVSHPILIERPIVVKNGKAMIGRPPKNILTFL